MKYCILSQPIGNLKICEENGKIIEIAFTDEAPREADGFLLQKACREIRKYLHGERKTFDLPLSLSGTEFQKAVWHAMCRIPYGQTRSYQEIAEEIGRPKAARAVGTACGKNRICIVVPCHRVVASHGIGGYAYGTERKKILLEVERNGR